MKNPLYIIAGPTACGKTSAAVELAKIIDGEVVSADSMLVYKGMDIGTAKPTTEEKKGVPHHLIDIIHPNENFSAALYQQYASKTINEIVSRGRVPILTGGTGFYINAVIYNTDFIPINENENEYRNRLAALAEEKGNEYLYKELTDADPETAVILHPNNTKRIIRALSFYHFTGTQISSHNIREKKRKPAYETVFIVLDMDRPVLHERINKRVAAMFERGLPEEVQHLMESGYHPGLASMQGIGYKEMIPYIKGKTRREEAIASIQTNTRRYAKRQITWFRHRAKEAIWLPASDKTAGELAEEIRHTPAKPAAQSAGPSGQ